MIEGLPVIDLTAPALLGFTVLLLLTGRLVPRQTLLDKAKEADSWRAAYEAERTARAASDKQVGELLEVSKTSYHLLQAIFPSSERTRSPGDPHEVNRSA